MEIKEVRDLAISYLVIRIEVARTVGKREGREGSRRGVAVESLF